MTDPSPSPANAGAADAASPRWKPLNPTQRRVLGVLVEKAKTTPEQYPLTLNALTTGCNQKNNRHPVTNLSPEQVEQAIEELRELGAVIEIQGGGRVPKYKHCLYEWLGVDKTELAVIAELLLRGEQTIGELRTRAARMEPIADVAGLRPILQSLKAKSLLLELTPEGRGQLVSHNLHKDRELAELTARASRVAAESYAASSEAPGDSRSVTGVAVGSPAAGGGRSAAAPPSVTRDMFNELQLEVAELRAEVARLRGIVQQLSGTP